jgi:hypothetical protein
VRRFIGVFFHCDGQTARLQRLLVSLRLACFSSKASGGEEKKSFSFIGKDTMLWGGLQVKLEMSILTKYKAKEVYSCIKYKVPATAVCRSWG